MAKMKVDQNKCIGCGACAATCSKSFEMKDGKASVKGEADCAKDAATGCLVGAISVA